MRAGSKIMLYSENIQRLIFLGDVEQKKPSGISSVNPSSLIEGSELLKWLLICKKVLNLRSLPRVQYQKGKKKKKEGGEKGRQTRFCYALSQISCICADADTSSGRCAYFLGIPLIEKITSAFFYIRIRKLA